MRAETTAEAILRGVDKVRIEAQNPICIGEKKAKVVLPLARLSPEGS